MKKISIILAIFMLIGILVSCDSKSTDAPATDSAIATATETAQPETVADTHNHDTNDTEELPAMGGTSEICMVHSDNYHSYSSILIDYVGNEDFYDWVINSEKISHSVNGCPYSESNIYEFIKAFNIPRQDLEDIYMNTVEYYGGVLNFDLLYSDDKEAIDQFYRNVDELRTIDQKRKSLCRMKINIRNEYADECERIFGDNAITPQVSIVDMVEALEIPRDKLEAYAKDRIPEDNARYDYNFDAIYNSDGSIRQSASVYSNNSVSQAEQSINEDMLFCGIDNFYTE